jgi:mevalonate kinase
LKERIEISAPGKLMLFGEHAVMYDCPCIVTAVDQRLTLAAFPIKERELRLNAPEVGVMEYRKDLDTFGIVGNGPKGVSFVEAAVKLFKERFELPFGVAIETKSEFAGSGLGSSSAAAVCTIKALSELLGKKLSHEELFALSYKAVLEVQETGSGFDVAAAIWGGTLLYVFGGEKIEPIPVENLPLVIGHSGIKAETPLMVKLVQEKYQRQKKIMEKIFALMGEIAMQARGSLEKGDFKQVGKLANINQGLLEAIGVGCGELTRLILAARNSGALGAKLSGAGGGDCMIAFVDENKKEMIEAAIRGAGGKIISAKTNAEGVKVK